MDWDDIRYFLALARAGTLSKAARGLGVTHVTVARRIARLEEGHQLRLFDRRQNGYRLSAAGERLLVEGESVERVCQQFERQMLGLSDVPEGALTVSVPEHSLIDLTPSITAFMRAYPGIKLTVLATSEELNLNQLQADVVIRMTNTPPELLVGRCLTQIALYHYGRRDYLASIQGDIKQADWAVWAVQSDSADEKLYLHELLPHAHVAMRTNSNSQLLAMVREGGVLALLAEPIARLYPELVVVDKSPVATLGLWLLTHSDLRDAARVRCFMQFMAERNWGGMG